MKIAFIWPQCDFLNLQWHCPPVDSFFIGATPEEVDTLITPHFTQTTAEEYAKHRKPWEGHEYFLISRDLSSVVPMPWYYPISGQWNGYSPFRYAQDKVIQNLQELKDINCEAL